MKQINNKKKIEENKEEKENKLLVAAFNLFTLKGVKKTSIQEIVNDAGVAKGTFYLYFKDKYDLQEYLIVKTSKQLFSAAIKASSTKDFPNYKEKIVFIIDYIINIFISNKHLLTFISKNLSWGLYKDHIYSFIDEPSIGLLELFEQELKKNNVKLKNPQVTLFMIIELTGASVFTSVTTKKPLPIEEFKTYLYEEIRKMLDE